MKSLPDITAIMTTFVLSTARIGTIFTMAPFFGPQFITGTVKNAIMISLAFIVMPIAMDSPQPLELRSLPFLTLLVKEMLIGFLMGFVITIPFSIADSVGGAIDYQRGATVGQSIDPTTGESTTTLGVLFVKMAVIIFFLGGGFLLFLAFMYKSYEIWPLFSYFPNFGRLSDTFTLALADSIMQTTVLISAPLFITLFLCEFGLGMMNRFAPQLNVFSLSMPIKSAMAVLLLVYYVPSLYKLFQRDIINSIELLSQLSNLLSLK